MKDGFLRVAAATPDIRVADCAHNLAQLLSIVQNAPEDTALLVFPELCLTGYTCGDLFFQPTLLKAAETALRDLLAATVGTDAVLIVGLPVAAPAQSGGGALYNCAAVCQRGVLLGLIPKTNIPGYAQFYESRHFTAAPEQTVTVRFAGQDTPMGTDLLFACQSLPDFVLGVEICEDVWAPFQPSQRLAAAGATVIANLSASDESIGKGEYRRQLVCTQSARLLCGYIYADAGEGESSTDLVFSGHNFIAENGTVLAESDRFTTGLTAVTELDLSRLVYDRRRINTFRSGQPIQTVAFDLPVRELKLTRPIPSLPFVPADTAAQAQRCEEVLTIQAAGLEQRLRRTGSRAVIGLSGGLDSALALLVTARAYDRMRLPREDIHTLTMPCFGTTGRTLNNARELARACGSTLSEIVIGDTVTRHLSDIGHSGARDVTYENAQARERTQVLMDVANQLNALVIGTGDLSELALGWATYNGDHMSMYGVNASVPKTLVRHLVKYEADRCGGPLAAALYDILDTPVSPELLPPENGVISQKTEQLVGPYELHDFFLYHMLRFGAGPTKLYRLAGYAFAGKFPVEEIKKWLGIFLRRFFSQQFKRSCLPDGPRVGSVSLSPRGDWRMPSDASVALWLTEADAL
ncbi:MAG: NAD(+) synthase [Clostridiales bacterium]|jgi:NAD+ synthase (glutamine-hydrolysing)|nr:NAD(+) synthase [Clostridiales bacterium]